MYTYIMERTQIYLTRAEHEELERLSLASGRSKAQLIREAIDRAYLGAGDLASVRSAIEETAGSWARAESGRALVERVRRSGRLRQLHGNR